MFQHDSWRLQPGPQPCQTQQTFKFPGNENTTCACSISCVSSLPHFSVCVSLCLALRLLLGHCMCVSPRATSLLGLMVALALWIGHGSDVVAWSWPWRSPNWMWNSNKNKSLCCTRQEHIVTGPGRFHPLVSVRFPSKFFPGSSPHGTTCCRVHELLTRF